MLTGFAPYFSMSFEQPQFAIMFDYIIKIRLNPLGAVGVGREQPSGPAV
jgi:hypothetical protein